MRRKSADNDCEGMYRQMGKMPVTSLISIVEIGFSGKIRNFIKKIGLIMIKKHILIRNQMIFVEISCCAVDFR
jgi:hypothetical protein